MFSLFFLLIFMPFMAASSGAGGKESACQCTKHETCGFDSWIQKNPWRRAWQPTPVFLPGESHGQRNQAGYSPWGHKESDTTEATQHRCTRGSMSSLTLTSARQLLFLQSQLLLVSACQVCIPQNILAMGSYYITSSSLQAQEWQLLSAFAQLWVASPSPHRCLFFHQLFQEILQLLLGLLPGLKYPLPCYYEF